MYHLWCTSRSKGLMYHLWRTFRSKCYYVFYFVSCYNGITPYAFVFNLVYLFITVSFVSPNICYQSILARVFHPDHSAIGVIY